MNWSISNIDKITEILRKTNVGDSQYFSHVRIASIDKAAEKEENVLFFPIYITDEEIKLDGWYINPIDLRKHINNIISLHPNYTYVIEESMEELIQNKDAKLLVVKSINKTIDDLFVHAMSKYHPDYICVTGSVGKTSTVALIEQMLQKKEETLRIYSKRITPLILKSYLINYLNDDIKNVVLEAGLYHRHHVEYFAKLLRPKIGVLLNVREEHLGIDGISSKEDILLSKVKLLSHCEKAIINGSDDLIGQLLFSSDEIYFGDKLIAEHQLEEVIAVKPDEIDHKNLNYTPYVLTNLSITQAEVLKGIAKIKTIDENVAIDAVNDFVPAEKRLQKQQLQGHNIYFDGDVSGSARINELSDHYYDNAILVIRDITSSGEEVEDYSKIVSSFDKYKRVYLFSDIIDMVPVTKSPKINVVDNHDFLNEINGSTIFYHYGSYYRSNSEYQEEVLLKGGYKCKK